MHSIRCIVISMAYNRGQYSILIDTDIHSNFNNGGAITVIKLEPHHHVSSVLCSIVVFLGCLLSWQLLV